MRPARSRARAGAATGFAGMSGRPASRRLFATRAAYHPCPAQHARCHSLCPRFTPNTRLTNTRPPALAPTEQDDGLGAGCTGRLRTPGDGSLRPSPHRALSCGTEAGRYLLLDADRRRRDGRHLRDPELDRRVAIKLVKPEPGTGSVSERSRGRLQREAQAAARLSHPNVVSAFDVGQLGDQVFIAMELVTGQTLRAWRQAQPRSPREILKAFLAALEGLAAAHAAGPGASRLQAGERPRRRRRARPGLRLRARQAPGARARRAGRSGPLARVGGDRRGGHRRDAGLHGRRAA